MNTIKTLGLVAVAALSLGIGAAMAQEGPSNDTQTGAAYFGPQAPVVASPARLGAVQSGSSDVEMRPAPAQWHPGNSYNNEGGQG
ncbi:MAG: hypothetical protein ABSE20_09170 [Acetobacteraceae bacterium]|jgi:hypothetical protein